METIINIRHFMDGDKPAKDLSPEAKELLNFLTPVIEAASMAYDQPISLLEAGCRNVINGRTCYGDLEVLVYFDSHYIGWECVECEDHGVITDWQGTPWDKRDFTCH